jgi:hypothetical protein
MLNSVKSTYLQDCCSRNTMCEQVVKLRPHLQNPCGRSLLDHFFGNDLDQGFPVWWWYWCFLCNLVAAKCPVSFRFLSWSPHPRCPYFCACTASYINNARLRFRPHSFATLCSSPASAFKPSFSPTPFSTVSISCTLGAATLTSRHLLLIGAMMLLVLLASRIKRRFGLYFSIVRRRAACASRVR